METSRVPVTSSCILVASICFVLQRLGSCGSAQCLLVLSAGHGWGLLTPGTILKALRGGEREARGVNLMHIILALWFFWLPLRFWRTRG